MIAQCAKQEARDFSSLHQTKLSPKLQTGLLASIQDSVELETKKKLCHGFNICLGVWKNILSSTRDTNCS